MALIFPFLFLLPVKWSRSLCFFGAMEMHDDDSSEQSFTLAVLWISSQFALLSACCVFAFLISFE